jgi:hypothetical protein
MATFARESFDLFRYFFGNFLLYRGRNQSAIRGALTLDDA